MPYVPLSDEAVAETQAGLGGPGDRHPRRRRLIPRARRGHGRRADRVRRPSLYARPDLKRSRRWPSSPHPTAGTLALRTSPRAGATTASPAGCSGAPPLITFVVTLLIIGTLAFDAWDFISKLADTADGLGALFDIGWFPRRGHVRHLDADRRDADRHRRSRCSSPSRSGVGSAIYLAEYARPRVRRIVKPIIEVLAGIPSVVLGYFAIASINPNIVVNLFSGANKAFTLAAAGIAVGILTVPIIASVTEDALRAVPLALREASTGSGARRSQTTFRVVFPAGDLRHHRRVDPRHVASDRRDDGRRHRRRRRRRLAVPPRPRSSPARR